MAVRLPLPITTPRPPFCRPHPSSRFFPICRASSSSATNTATTCTLKLTYLEINTWVWELHQDHHPKVRILVDPILVGDLDFGAPWLFNGAKKNPWMKALGVDKAMEPPPDLLLITQSLDDHCHVRTLKQLSALAPDLPVVTTPNARPVLASLPTPFRRVTYLEPGQSTAAAADHIRILAAVAAPRERLHRYYCRRRRRPPLLRAALRVRQLIPGKQAAASTGGGHARRQAAPPCQLHPRLRPGGRRRPRQAAAGQVRGSHEQRRRGR
jgi:hypothetical protein